MPFGRRFVPLILCAIGGSQCGGSSPAAPSTPPPGIALTCPAPQTKASASGFPVAVTYALPSPAGGTTPIATSCAPVSGASFPVGTTTVSCNSVDAKQQTASCSFGVTVTPPPRTLVTRYVSFGDSITEGFPHFSGRLVDPAPIGSYPAVLLSMLTARYTAQTIDVFDEGVGGEIIATGLARLPGVLSLDNPGALLLMEGANDLNQFGAAGIDTAVSQLQQMVRLGQARSAAVFIGTLLPERANGTPARASFPELVVPLNTKIRSMAASEGAALVDLYAAFGGAPDPLLVGPDGLHPTAAGNDKIAQTFYDVIRTRLEASSGAISPSRR